MTDRISFASINAERGTAKPAKIVDHKILTAEERAARKAQFTADMAAAEARHGKPRTLAQSAGTSSHDPR